MTGAASETGFSLAYELEPDDFIDLYQALPKRKFRRTQRGFLTVVYALIAAILAIFVITLDLRAKANGTSGAPDWLHGVDAGLWVVAIYSGWVFWRLSPRRLARRQWNSNVPVHGRHHDEVGPGGIITQAPDGTQGFIPWTVIARIDESDRAFNAFDHDDRLRMILPKRGLASPDLIPRLREFLNHSARRAAE
jgi:YcxB-like protein